MLSSEPFELYSAKKPHVVKAILFYSKSMYLKKRDLKADFHSVQNVARSIFSERFLLKCVRSTTANEICSA